MCSFRISEFFGALEPGPERSRLRALGSKRGLGLRGLGRLGLGERGLGSSGSLGL